MLTVLLVSGGRGKTAQQMASAAIAQFENPAVKLLVRGKIRTEEQLRSVVQEAKDCGGVILHTLVSDELRRLMLKESRLNGVDAMDLLGPVLDRLAAHLKLVPKGQPGLLARTVEGKTRQIEAVDFAFRHDDGQRMDELDQAEIVLVGVSRSMKTPTMLYLAYRGWFAANVPLVLGVDLSDRLESLDPKHVFYLHMAADRLRELRRVRALRTDIPVDPYASMDNIRKELRYAEGACARRGWRKVDTTGKSVEEVSREIIALAAEDKSQGPNA